MKLTMRGIGIAGIVVLSAGSTKAVVDGAVNTAGLATKTSARFFCGHLKKCSINDRHNTSDMAEKERRP